MEKNNEIITSIYSTLVVLFRIRSEFRVLINSQTETKNETTNTLSYETLVVLFKILTRILTPNRFLAKLE